MGTVTKFDVRETAQLGIGGVTWPGTGAEIGLRVRIVETETAIALASVSASGTASSGNVFVRLPGPFGSSVHGSSPVDAAVQQAVVALAEEVVAAFAELQAANELEMSEEAPED
ncbi:MAG TPA: CsgG/HfaB family protein [Limnochordales bacterium]